MQRILTGLNIIARYEPNADFCAEHDVIYVGDDDLPSHMTPEDVAQMEALDWFIGQDVPGWQHFC